MGTRRGRPPVDPLVRDNARLAAENARLRDQLARQAKLIEVQGELSALLGRLATGTADPAAPGLGEPDTPTPPPRR